MDLLMFHLDNINWVAVLIATVFSYAIGGLWYSQALFGKVWMKEIGLKPKDMQSAKMTRTFAATGVLAFTSATGLAVLMKALEFDTWQQGLVFGVIVSVAFAATSRGIHMLFEQKGLTLFLINALHDVVFLAVAGLIIGAL